MKREICLAIFSVTALFGADQKPQGACVSSPVGTVGGKAPSGLPAVTNPIISADLEFFVGTARTFGTEYAENESSETLTAGGTKTTYDHKDQSFGWAPGLKAGLGWVCAENDWDVWLKYLFYNDSHSTSASGDLVISRASPVLPGNNVTYLYSNNAGSSFYTRIINYSLELGKSFFIGDNVSLRGHAGVFVGDITELQTITYRQLKTTVAAVAVDQSFRVKTESQYVGAGPQIGADLTYFLSEHWNLFSDTSLSMLGGSYALNMRQKYSGNDAQFIDKSSFFRFVPQTSLNLGLGYSHLFEDKSTYFSARLGYEIQYWWNQYLRYDLTSALNELDYDMAFQRCFINVMFEF